MKLDAGGETGFIYADDLAGAYNRLHFMASVRHQGILNCALAPYGQCQGSVDRHSFGLKDY